MSTSEGITIDPKELRTKATEMRRDISMMKDSLDISNSVMAETENYFEASSADEIRNNYNQLKGNFELFYEKMNSYADFLDSTKE